jgi:hypothetical protein
MVIISLYQTIRLNEAVKRNIERFPERFMFQLTDTELIKLVTNCDRFNSLKHSSSLPYAFTEHGVTMLASVLKSDIAVQYTKAHDRFLIIDDKVYHVGASIKDLGKKLCAVSLLTCINANEMLNRIV